MKVKHLALPLLAAFLLSACDTSLPTSNPYDPDLPEHQKQPGALLGSVALEASEDPGAALVEVRPAGKSTSPASDGSFLIEDLPPGSYTIVVSAQGHGSQTRAGVFVGVGQTVDLGVIALRAARGAIDGLVALMREADEEASSHGGAVVTARSTDVAGGPMRSHSTVSNPDGSWGIGELPAGTWDISGSKDGYAPSEPIKAEIKEDGTTTVSTLVLRAITGVVKIAGGKDFTSDASVVVEVVAFNTDEMQIANAPDFTDVAWEPHAALKDWVLDDLEDGDKTVFMRFRNFDGYTTPALYDTIVLDRRAPVAGSVEIAAGEPYVTDASVGLALHAEDALSGVAEMLISIDGTIDDETFVPYEPHRTVTLPVGLDPDEVPATVLVQYKDGAGNESLAVQDTVIVDSVAPQSPSIVVDDGAALTASRVVTLTLSAQGASEMKLSNDSGLAGAFWQPYVSSLGWGLTEGDEIKTVYAQFRDAAGNESAIVQDSIELNTKGSVSGVFLLEGAATGGHAGIDVSLSTEPVRTETTDASGAVTFVDVPIGLYSATATRAAFRKVNVPLFAVEPDQVTDLGEFTLSVARGDLTGLALREGGAAGEHGGILVEVVGFDDDTTSADGTWTVRNIPVGQVTVQARAEGYGAAQATDVDVIAEQETTVPDLVLPANPGSVSGIVALEGRTAPNLDGVTILVAGQSAVSAGDGSFLVPGVPAGTHPLTASLSGFATLQTVVPVEAGQDSDAGTLSLKIARGAVEGRATLAGASDHSGVTVELGGTGYAGLSSGTGNYRIESVPIGTYSLTARKDEYVPKSAGSLTVLEGETVTAAEVELVRQSGDFDIEERATGDAEYLNHPAVRLVFGTVPPDSAQILVSEDSGFAGATWENFSPLSHDFDLTSGDGTVTVFVKFKDTLDQESPVFSASAVLDRVPPLDTSSVQINGIAAWTTDPNVNLTLVGLDDTSGVEFMTISVDGVFDTETDESFKATVTRSLESATDGQKSVWVQFVDRAGNRSAAPVTDTIYLDRAAPGNDTIAINGGAVYATDALVTLALTAEEACTDDYPTGGCVAGIVAPAQMMLSNQPGFPGAGWEAFALSRVWFLTPGDGTKRVHVKFRDGAGNASNPIWAEIELDRTPPGSPSIVIQGADVTSGPTVDLALSASGSPIQMKVVQGADLAGATWQDFAPTLNNVAISGADGLKLFSAQFRDAAGNESAVAQDSVELDTTAPWGTLAIVESPYALNTSVTLVLTSPEADEMCIVVGSPGPTDCALPGDWQDFSASTNAVLTGGEGVNEVSVMLRDVAGNESAYLTASTILDLNPPANGSVAIMGTRYDLNDQPVNDAALTALSELELTLDSSDSGSGVDQVLISNDPAFSGALWRSFQSSPMLLDGWSLGSAAADDEVRTVYVKYRDAAGRESAAAVSDTIRLDNVAPTSASVLVEAGAEYTLDATVDLALSAQGATYARWDDDSLFPGQAWQSNWAGATVTVADVEGLHTVYAEFRDDAGNRSAVASDSIFYDRGDPAAPANLASPGLLDGVLYYIDSLTPVLSWTHPDVSDVDHFVVDVGGAIYWSSSVALQVPALAEAQHAWRVRAADRAGRESAWVNGTDFVVDVTSPSGPLLEDPPQPVVNTATQGLSLSVFSTDANFKEYQIWWSGFGVWTSRGDLTSYTYGLAQDADNLLKVRALDLAGNISDEHAVSVAEDSTAPTAPEWLTPNELLQNPAGDYVLNADIYTFSLATPSVDPHLQRYETCLCRVLPPIIDDCATDCINSGPGWAFTPGPPFNVSLVGVEDWSARLRVRGCDGADNCSVWDELALFEDSTLPSAPELEIDYDVLGGVDMLFFGPSALLVIEKGDLDDNLYRFVVRETSASTEISVVPGADPLLYTTSATVPFTVGQENRYEVVAEDYAGNRSTPTTAVLDSRPWTALDQAPGAQFEGSNVRCGGGYAAYSRRPTEEEPHLYVARSTAAHTPVRITGTEGLLSGDLFDLDAWQVTYATVDGLFVRDAQDDLNFDADDRVTHIMGTTERSPAELWLTDDLLVIRDEGSLREVHQGWITAPLVRANRSIGVAYRVTEELPVAGLKFRLDPVGTQNADFYLYSKPIGPGQFNRISGPTSVALIDTGWDEYSVPFTGSLEPGYAYWFVLHINAGTVAYSLATGSALDPPFGSFVGASEQVGAPTDPDIPAWLLGQMPEHRFTWKTDHAYDALVLHHAGPNREFDGDLQGSDDTRDEVFWLNGDGIYYSGTEAVQSLAASQRTVWNGYTALDSTVLEGLEIPIDMMLLPGPVSVNVAVYESQAATTGAYSLIDSVPGRITHLGLFTDKNRLGVLPDNGLEVPLVAGRHYLIAVSFDLGADVTTNYRAGDANSRTPGLTTLGCLETGAYEDPFPAIWPVGGYGVCDQRMRLHLRHDRHIDRLQAQDDILVFNEWEEDPDGAGGTIRSVRPLLLDMRAAGKFDGTQPFTQLENDPLYRGDLRDLNQHNVIWTFELGGGDHRTCWYDLVDLGTDCNDNSVCPSRIGYGCGEPSLHDGPYPRRTRKRLWLEQDGATWNLQSLGIYPYNGGPIEMLFPTERVPPPAMGSLATCEEGYYLAQLGGGGVGLLSITRRTGFPLRSSENSSRWISADESLWGGAGWFARFGGEINKYQTDSFTRLIEGSPRGSYNGGLVTDDYLLEQSSTELYIREHGLPEVALGADEGLPGLPRASAPDVWSDASVNHFVYITDEPLVHLYDLVNSTYDGPAVDDVDPGAFPIDATNLEFPVSNDAVSYDWVALLDTATSTVRVFSEGSGWTEITAIPGVEKLWDLSYGNVFYQPVGQPDQICFRDYEQGGSPPEVCIDLPARFSAEPPEFVEVGREAWGSLAGFQTFGDTLYLVERDQSIEGRLRFYVVDWRTGRIDLRGERWLVQTGQGGEYLAPGLRDGSLIYGVKQSIISDTWLLRLMR